ncbi:hypothetical protein [Streptomyces spectabilis]|uniref:DUF8094 domain-containing protein n=1 Tax=Streptomyces spectabilis TaxID=68270 RepID=A0A5P2X8W0_STRST|nr:hypothetical protein [Streptomyces spectabilis]MBB5103012.1 hypothetical protein [Streptomyces spectabilis]MCI3902207.1 hypothetical protein [Streptomyces spectabilis]QEV59585.1 hypothetical protein CP982_13275 [Streptomyces spectabilis]GGV15322.1 putative lipoprotein [Streptomyces spectabilis]
MIRVRRLGRCGASAAVALALAMAAGGCVTVHGEREVVPTATKAEAARALKEFLRAYNKADKAYDPALDAARVTGPLGAINQAGLKARRAQNPDGNARHVPLRFTDVEYAVPKKAGWPRFFVVNALSNRKPHGYRWLIVFTRAGGDRLWQATYLNLVRPDRIPDLKKDEDGFAEPVAVDQAGLALAPRRLGARYTAFLKSGGDAFAAGPHTTQWKAARDRNAKRLGLAVQYLDEPRDAGAFAPVGLRTRDGGALVFFSTHHYEKQTASTGRTVDVEPDVKALMKGEAKQSVTLERVSNQVSLTPRAKGEISILGRMQGLVGAKGE